MARRRPAAWLQAWQSVPTAPGFCAGAVVEHDDGSEECPLCDLRDSTLQHMRWMSCGFVPRDDDGWMPANDGRSCARCEADSALSTEQ